MDFEVQKFGSSLEVVNRGNVDITHLDIKMFSGGDSEVEKFNFKVDGGASVREDVTLLMRGNVIPDKVIVYPALIGNVKGGSSNRVFTCMDAGKVL